MSEIHNNWMLRQLQKKLNSDAGTAFKFKNITKCLKIVCRKQPGVLIESNSETAKFTGLAHCGNSWLCPCCSAKVMAKQAKYIASALDVAKSQGLVAFMATFTIGHNYWLTADEVVSALYESWKLAYVCCATSKSKLNSDPFYLFLKNCQVKHYIKVCEINFSYKKGWHPHFHVLFFVPKDKISECLKYEVALGERWQEVCKMKLKQQIKKRTENQLQEEYIDNIYDKKDPSSVGVFFSKNQKNQIIIQKSSSYITGWDLKSEITGSTYKTETKSKSSITIPDLLERALKDDDEYAWRKFLELANAVYKKRARISWSHSKLKAQAFEHLDEYEETFKKNSTQEVKKQPLKPVGFIPYRAWLKISRMNNFEDISFLILQFAKYSNGFDLICELLQSYDLPPLLKWERKEIPKSFNRKEYLKAIMESFEAA